MDHPNKEIVESILMKMRQHAITSPTYSEVKDILEKHLYQWERSDDLWCFVDDARGAVENKISYDWVDISNLLRVVDALKHELEVAVESIRKDGEGMGGDNDPMIPSGASMVARTCPRPHFGLVSCKWCGWRLPTKSDEAPF